MTFFIFLVTPAGVVALYRVLSGTGRVVCAVIDDPCGDWAGLTGVDLVVPSARRKPEWNAGAIMMRTVYPLTKMDTVEVVRRGILYELRGNEKAPSRCAASRGFVFQLLTSNF